LRGAPHDSNGNRGYRTRRPARAEACAGRRGNLRAVGNTRGRAGAGGGSDLSRLCAKEQRHLPCLRAGAVFHRRGRVPTSAVAHPQRADATDEAAWLRQGLPLRTRRAGRVRGRRALSARRHARCGVVPADRSRAGIEDPREACRAAKPRHGCSREEKILAGRIRRIPDMQLLRGDLADVAARVATRGYSLDTAKFETAEAERKAIQMRTQELQARRNTLSKQIGAAKSKGQDATALLSEV